MGEKRRSKRISEKNRAIINGYFKYDHFINEEKTAVIHELSGEGVRLLTFFELSPETECKISLDLAESNQMVQLWARVKWTEKTRRQGEYAMGLEFVHTQESRAQLRVHLDRGKRPLPR